MKRVLVILFLISINRYSNAQNRSNVWELSYNDTLAYPNCGINFNSGKADTFTVYRTMAFFNTDASICDSNGNLLFYTNGVYISNKNNDTLFNSSNFDTGWATAYYGSEGLGFDQGEFIIPFPEHQSDYYLFYITGEQIYRQGQYAIQPLHLSYSVVDMNLDNGLGGVVADKKNIFAIQDTLLQGYITGVKHANGRDWWIIAHKYFSNEYYKLLVTPDSIHGPYTQNIGSELIYNASGQSVFSPDGSKFAMLGPTYVLDYMNFDRCTGDFYNSQTINIPNIDSDLTIGCSFSPGGRFLYVSTRFTLWQYDTWASNISSSGIKVGVYDNFEDSSIDVVFFTHTLAPDSKIYISTFNSTLHLHAINSPDSLGTACNFIQHSFVLPQWNISIPSFPNYDLGALSGSPCDTLNGINQLAINSNQLSIYPNPTTNLLNINYSISQQSTADLFDVLGRKIKEFTLYPYYKSRIIHVNQLLPGIYELRLVIDNEELVKKFVKE